MAFKQDINERLERLTVKIGDCILFTGALDKDGYGLIKIDGKMRRAHRWNYIRIKGPIDEGLQLDHLCRSRSCINVDHLEPVTPKENTNRGINPRTLQVNCIRGHPLYGDNLYNPNGKRQCKQCRNDRWTLYYEKNKEKLRGESRDRQRMYRNHE